MTYNLVNDRSTLATSAIATGVLGFITTVLLLFCIPDLDMFFSLDALQPFILLYALALTKVRASS